ncbi:MAG: VOC family protein [Chloroflexi bacterium]|nr:MAG: VOC family protein [Chloroflexota bacterium]
MQKFTTCLMFVGEQHGKAEEAINLYVSLFKNSKIIKIERYGAGESEPEGTVKHATFSLNGQEFMALDSALKHEFTFTPSMSIFVQCESEEEIDTLYKRFIEGGSAKMPLDNYGFSRKFAWVADSYGVSWQLNLAKN